MSVALADELLALGMPWAAARSLLEMGVPGDLVGELTGSGGLAVGQVDLLAGGLFEFGGPDRRLILTVRNPAGEAVDLVALSSRCEDEWALRLGVADVLGDAWLTDAVLAERRELRLFATPMAWLRGGGRGVCVLDWTRGALGALRGLGPRVTLVVDHGTGPKLKGLLAYGGLPLVAEDRPAMEMAA